MPSNTPNFDLPDGIGHPNTPSVAAAKKTPNTEKPISSKRMVEIDFSGTPREFQFFNRHRIEKFGDFVLLTLGFVDHAGPVVTVFRGIVWGLDLVNQIPSLQKYIEKIGAPEEAHMDTWSANGFPSVPVPFNQIECASRGSWAEVAIRQFSHKSAMDLKPAVSETSVVSGITHGVYISDVAAHKRMIFDLIVSAPTQA